MLDSLYSLNTHLKFTHNDYPTEGSHKLYDTHLKMSASKKKATFALASPFARGRSVSMDSLQTMRILPIITTDSIETENVPADVDKDNVCETDITTSPRKVSHYSSPFSRNRRTSGENLLQKTHSPKNGSYKRIMKKRTSLGSQMELRETDSTISKSLLTIPQRNTLFRSPLTKRRSPSCDSITEDINIPNHKQAKHRSSLGCEKELHENATKKSPRHFLSAPSRKLSSLYSPLTSPFTRRRTSSLDNLESLEHYQLETVKAIQSNECKRVKLLLKKGIYDNFLLLNEACNQGCLKCLRYIINAGYNTDVVYKTNWSLLHTAVYTKNKEIMKFLISNGCDINSCTSDGWTPLLVAVYVSDLIAVHELIRSGANPLFESNSATSALQLSIDTENWLLLDYLIHLSHFLVSI